MVASFLHLGIADLLVTLNNFRLHRDVYNFTLTVIFSSCLSIPGSAFVRIFLQEVDGVDVAVVGGAFFQIGSFPV